MPNKSYSLCMISEMFGANSGNTKKPKESLSKVLCALALVNWSIEDLYNDSKRFGDSRNARSPRTT